MVEVCLTKRPGGKLCFKPCILERRGGGRNRGKDGRKGEG